MERKLRAMKADSDSRSDLKKKEKKIYDRFRRKVDEMNSAKGRAGMEYRSRILQEEMQERMREKEMQRQQILSAQLPLAIERRTERLRVLRLRYQQEQENQQQENQQHNEQQENQQHNQQQYHQQHNQQQDHQLPAAPHQVDGAESDDMGEIDNEEPLQEPPSSPDR